jgi:hypothetical protein
LIEEFKNIPDKSAKSFKGGGGGGGIKEKMKEIFKDFLRDAEAVKKNQDTIYFK